MLKTNIIRVEEWDSMKDGKIRRYALAWVNTGNGLPCKVWLPRDVQFKDGDLVNISIEPDRNCNARLVVSKCKE